MNLITPERVPVTVYRWDDANAPVLDKTPNCVASIIKACLVAGYGSKQPAGWSMAYEDMAADVKVLKPPVTAEKDYLVRLSQDNGKQMTVQIYENMTDINTGALLLQCDAPYKYHTGTRYGGGATGKWMMIASSRGAWFFNEVQDVDRAKPANKQGAYLYFGDSCSGVDGVKHLCLLHSGGNADGAVRGFPTIIQDAGSINFKTPAKVYDKSESAVFVATPMAFFNGMTDLTSAKYLSQVAMKFSNKLLLLPGYTSSNRNDVNYSQMNNGGRTFINHGTGNHSTTYEDYIDNFYVATDFWEM